MQFLYKNLNLTGSGLQQNALEFWQQSCANVTRVKGQICRNPVLHSLGHTTNPKRSVIYQREQISRHLHQAGYSTTARLGSFILHTHTSSSFPLQMENQWESQRSLNGSVRLRTWSHHYFIISTTYTEQTEWYTYIHFWKKH